MRPSKLKLNEKQKRLVFLIEFIFRRRNRRSRIKRRHLGARLEKMQSQLSIGKVIISRANFLPQIEVFSTVKVYFSESILQ